MNEQAPEPPFNSPASNLERLWTPWRMQYVGNGPAEEGCVFCNRLAASDDVDSLILYRARHAFLIMNLFPYNTGHLMIVPNLHAASPEELDDETQIEMTQLLPPVLRAVRRGLNPGGFNVGMNLGWVAGAGIAAHLHQHVVPRWSGDANFMPILANTKVLPELIPTSYAKIRTELEREMHGAAEVIVVAFDPQTELVLVQSLPDASGFHLPRVQLVDDKPANSSLSSKLEELGVQGYLAGWGGLRMAHTPGTPALVYLVQSETDPPTGWRFVARNETGSFLDQGDAAIAASAIDHLKTDTSDAKTMSVHPSGL